MGFDTKYNKTIQGLTDAIYVCDASGFISLFNKAASDLWGREPVIGKDQYCGSVKLINGDGSDLEKENYPIVKALRECRPVQDAEIIMLRPDGTCRRIIQYATPVFSIKGILTCVVNRQVDVTELSDHCNKMNLIN